MICICDTNWFQYIPSVLATDISTSSMAATSLERYPVGDEDSERQLGILRYLKNKKKGTNMWSLIYALLVYILFRTDVGAGRDASVTEGDDGCLSSASTTERVHGVFEATRRSVNSTNFVFVSLFLMICCHVVAATKEFEKLKQQRNQRFVGSTSDPMYS